VPEMLDERTPERPLAYTTVLSVMDKLHRKGWLHPEPDSRGYRYVPVQTRDAYSATLMREARVASTDQRSAIVHFVEQMSAAEASALQAALDAGLLDPHRAPHPPAAHQQPPEPRGIRGSPGATG